MRILPFKTLPKLCISHKCCNVTQDIFWYPLDVLRANETVWLNNSTAIPLLLRTSPVAAQRELYAMAVRTGGLHVTDGDMDKVIIKQSLKEHLMGPALSRIV